MTESPYFIVGLAHEILGPDKVRISWTNPDGDPPSKARVLYWEEDQPMQETPESPLKDAHSVDLTGLKPNTLYYYRARSRRDEPTLPGGEKVSIFPLPPDANSFRTPRGFEWAGFFPPVANLPATNVDNAGRTIPMKFSLGGNHGLNIFAAGYPKSELTATAGSLSYDARDDQYTYTWRTDRAWSGQTRLFVLKLIDGSEHKANFQFR
jgi:hypothetical protein